MNFDPLAMDGNKDDALKCLNIARKALNIGDRNRAVKFIAKARRLDPKLPLDDLLSSLEQESNCSSASSSSVSESASSNNPSLRQRVSSNGLSSEKGYSEEQVKLVRKVRNLKDYYEILGVERSCSVEDVRKAYRKLSLKVHPDKNKAPGAEEAFKAVSKAFQCLSNEESKKKYDVCGSDEVVYERAAARRGARAQGFNGFYDMDVDADEIFRNFFYGGMPGATTQFRGFTFRTGGAPMGGDHGSGNLNLRALVQLLPFFIIILSNFIPSSQPIYALSKSYPYEYRFSTARGVNYYVRTARFEQEYPYNSAARVQLEAKVERDYFSILIQNCRAELQRRQWGLAHETPHCDRLDQLQARA